MNNIEAIAKRYEKIAPVLDERMRRLWGGAESSVIGFGGIEIVSKATGLSRNTIVRGEQELEDIEKLPQSMFCWENNLENDNERFLEYLQKNYGIDWIKTAKIEKIDDGKTLRIFTEKKFISLKLNNDKTRLIVKIDDSRTYEFKIEVENGKLNIYMSQNSIRKVGGGRKKAIDIHPEIKDELSKLIEPVTRGDPVLPLMWTCKSLRNLSSELENKGYNPSSPDSQ